MRQVGGGGMAACRYGQEFPSPSLIPSILNLDTLLDFHFFLIKVCVSHSVRGGTPQLTRSLFSFDFKQARMRGLECSFGLRTHMRIR